MTPIANLLSGFNLSFSTLASALNVLAAMITPALLMSATGTFIFSTTTRLGRVVDRMRAVSEKVEELALSKNAEMRLERLENYRLQLKKLNVRLMLLQRSATVLYVASGTFVLTSVAIGVVAVISIRLYWIPVALGLAGALMLLAASIMLIFEARHAVRDLQDESQFLGRLAQHIVETEKAESTTSAEAGAPKPAV